MFMYILTMWYSVVGLLYSPFVIQMMASHRPPSSSPSPSLVTESPINSSCPTNDRTYLYYPHLDPKIRGCYAEDSTGPCGENMIMYAKEENTRYGECDCTRNSIRTLIYHHETQRCYPIFTQGYCQQGKWLDLDPAQNGMPVCEDNPCWGKSGSSNAKTNDELDLVLIKGKCQQVGSPSPFCEKGQVVGFNQTMRLPTCILRSLPGIGIRTIGAIPIKCRPGTYRAITGRCQPEFEFDWD